MSDVWALIQNGEYKEAIRVADEEFNKTSSRLPVRNKVFALLCLKNYSEAAELCKKLIELERGDTDSDFIFLGVAKWLSGQHDEAIKAWQATSDTTYSDAAGGVEILLLLNYAAIRLGNSSLRLHSEKQLKALCKRSRISNWPGPIARFVLRQINEKDLLSATSSQPILKAKQISQAEFHIGVMRIAEGDVVGGMELMQRSISRGPVCLLKQEFYLADAEVRGYPGTATIV